MHEFSDTPDPEDFEVNQPDPADEHYDTGDNFDPTNGIVPSGENDANEGTQQRNQPPPSAADLPPDPFGDPFNEGPAAEERDIVHGAIEGLASSLESMARIGDASDDSVHSPALENVTGAMENLGNVFRRVAVHAKLKEQGLTVDTGRSPQEFGVEELKAYSPDSYEEADLARYYMGAFKDVLMKRHAPYAREERYEVDGVQHIREVLELRYGSKEGVAHFELTSDSIIALFQPTGGQVTNNRYHVVEGSLTDEIDGAFLRRDTTDLRELMADEPYGAVPSSEIWATKHKRLQTVTETLQQDRDIGVNDIPISFAEVQYVCNMLDKAKPTTSLTELLKLGYRRAHSERQPLGADAYAAALKFRDIHNGYLQRKGIRDPYEPAQISFPVPIETYISDGAVEVGRDVTIADEGVAIDPYVKINGVRRFDGQALANELQRLKQHFPDCAATGLETRYSLRYDINNTNHEMMVHVNVSTVDETGRVYTDKQYSRRTDIIEPDTINRMLAQY
jgi:hypothetical protein